MRLGINLAGDPFFKIKIDHFVTKEIFAGAIADYLWEKDENFDPKIKRSDAMKLLKNRLFFHGIEGMYKEHWDAAGPEYGEKWNDLFFEACEWVGKNYPYLCTNS